MDENKLQKEIDKLIISLSKKGDYDSVADLKWIKKNVENLIKNRFTKDEIETLINSAFILNKNILTYSEDVELAFEKGIKVGVNRVIEKLK